MTQDWSAPGAVVLAGLVGALLVLAVLAVFALRGRARAVRAQERAERAERSAAEAAEAVAALRREVEQIRTRAATRVTPAQAEWVITGLDGPLADTPAPGRRVQPAPVVPAPLFADLVVREGTVQVAALAAGVRRALSPEVRHRIRFEMRREVKRARKQRRADLRAARREWEARQRAEPDADDAGSAA